MNYRNRFFNKKNEFLTLAQIVEITGSRVLGEVDLSRKIYDVATLERGGAGEISFLSSSQYFQKFCQSKVEFCLIDEKSAKKAARDDVVCVINENPYFAYSQIADAFYEEKMPQFCTQNIHPNAKIGQNCVIAPTAFIGENVEIGRDCYIASNVVIADGCVIGDGCVINSCAVICCAVVGDGAKIYAGVKIGQDGFGFAHHKGVNHKIIQIGIVEIGDDVEIGANSCVDRGAIENTIIGDNVKIDNLVQIAHNVEIGQGTVIAGCSAVAGSAKIARFVQIGGKSSISGHITLHDGAKVAGMSGVVRDVAPMQAVAGIPAVAIRDWHRMNIKLKKI